MHPNRYSRFLALEEKQPRQWAALAQARSAAVEGVGRVLVLVDVTMPAGGMVPQEAQEQTRRWPDPNLGARPQGNMVPFSNLTRPEVETWLVVNGDLTPIQNLKDKLDLSPLRLVPLAAP